ncbi:MAG: hypothetical protein R2932_05865 [Caldilineaceae bacterium]
MQNPNYETWRRRGAALQETMQHQLQLIQAGDTVERQPTLLALLSALQAFGQSQLDFFIDGFGVDANVRLEPSTDYPPEYAMRATVDQIAYDLDVIQRAYQQRLPSQSTEAMRTTLAKADILAYRALQPAINAGLIENTTVVTYFQKAVNVRIIPYAPVAFIGLPLSALAVSRDLLAIPHEVGHYVFRNGKAQTGQYAGSRFAAALDRELSGLPAWCRAWLEEIFADVYGAVVGGPVMALGFEDLLTDDRITEFTHDDGEHPVAALRPDVYYEVFAQQADHQTEAALLEKRWQAQFDLRGAPTDFTPAGGAAVQLTDAKAVIAKAIAIILNGDLGQLQVDRALWSGSLTDEADPAALYDYFDGVVEELANSSATQVPDIEVTVDREGQPCALQLAALDKGYGTPVSRQIGETGLWLDAVKGQANHFNMPPQVWMALLDGSGWAVEGPGGVISHGK